MVTMVSSFPLLQSALLSRSLFESAPEVLVNKGLLVVRAVVVVLLVVLMEGKLDLTPISFEDVPDFSP